MSFKGDLSTIGLAEVFQMISMSQKQGTLIVQDSESRKCIYFGENGVELLSTGKRKGLRVGDLLVRAGKISEEALSEALENAKIQRKLVGEVLVESGAIASGDIQDVVRSQIEEEIYDLFLWKKANFEFIEGPPSDALRDPEAPVTKLAFDVNGLLLEAVRRADEWGLISQKIPSMDSIFVFVSESDRREEDKTAPDHLKRVYRLIDGQGSVSDLVEATGISRFDVCKALLDLVDRGRIRILAVPEVLEVAARRSAEGRRDKAFKLYQAAAAQAPDDPKVIQGVAKILEGEGQSRDAATHYAKTGRLFMNQGNLERALECMEKALSLSPEDPDVKLGMFEIHAAAGNLPEGKKLAQELIAAALLVPDYPRARMLCDRIISADPSDLSFRTLRAKIFHRSGLKKELEEDLAFIRKNMPVDPGQADKVLRDLKEVLGSSPAIGRRPSAVVKPRARGRRGRWVAAAGVLVLLGGLGFAGKYELDARGDLEGRYQEVQRLWVPGEAKFADARRILEQFIQKYRYSFLQVARAREYLDEVENRRESWERDKKNADAMRVREMRQKMQDLAAAIDDLRRTQPEEALKKAKELRALAEKEKDPEFLAIGDQRERELNEYISRAWQLLQEANDLEKEDKFPQAAEKIDLLIQNYSTTDVARSAKYPLKITTWPPGVKVTLLGNDFVLGETGEKPVVHRMHPTAVVRFRFERRGYRSEERSITKKTVGEIHVDLAEKLVLWAKPFGFAIAGEPAVLGESVFVGVSRQLYAVSAKDGLLRWHEPLNGNIIGGPRVANGLIYCSTNGNSVYALDPANADKRVVWEYPTAGRPVTSPGFAPDGSLLYVVSDDRVLHAVSAKDGKEAWRRDLPYDCRTDPIGVSGGVVLSCADGWILAVKGPRAVEDKLWDLRIEGGPLGPTCVTGGILYAGGVDQYLYAVDLNQKVLAWRRGLPAPVQGRAARQANTLVAGARDGSLYFFDAGTGERLRTPAPFGTGGAIVAGVALSDALALFGSDDTFLYAYETAAGRLRWQFKTKGKARTIPVPAGGRVFLAVEDTLYAIELN